MSSGRSLDASVIQRKLLELNPDFSFDVMNKLSECVPVLGAGFKRLNPLRQGVYWKGTHVCSMDRGVVPEYPTFFTVKRRMPVDAAHADDDGVVTTWRAISPGQPEYVDALLHALNQDAGWELRPDGVIIASEWSKTVEAAGPKEYLGWRPTLLKIMRRGIPGVNFTTLGAKFETDMAILPDPGASAYDLHRVFVEE